jgi:hypothetical protein
MDMAVDAALVADVVRVSTTVHTGSRWRALQIQRHGTTRPRRVFSRPSLSPRGFRRQPNVDERKSGEVSLQACSSIALLSFQCVQ